MEKKHVRSSRTSFYMIKGACSRSWIAFHNLDVSFSVRQCFVSAPLEARRRLFYTMLQPFFWKQLSTRLCKHTNHPAHDIGECSTASSFQLYASGKSFCQAWCYCSQLIFCQALSRI